MIDSSPFNFPPRKISPLRNWVVPTTVYSQPNELRASCLNCYDCLGKAKLQYVSLSAHLRCWKQYFCTLQIQSTELTTYILKFRVKWSLLSATFLKTHDCILSTESILSTPNVSNNQEGYFPRHYKQVCLYKGHAFCPVSGRE